MERNILSLGFMAAIILLTFNAIANAAQDNPEKNAAQAEQGSMPFTLLQAQADLQGSLDNMDSEATDASWNLSATGLEGTKAHEILIGLLGSNPNLIEAATFSSDGKILF